jgi:cell pole-organizing protein PopZ
MGAVNHKISEPSMEEILASIRRIIADDQEVLLDELRPEPSSDLSPLRNVLDITERHVAPQVIAISPAEPVDLDEELVALASAMGQLDPEEAPEPDFTRGFQVERAAPRPAPSIRYVSPRRTPEPARQDALLSQGADASVSGAFGRLGAAVASGNSPKTLEDIAQEMLRPMLKAWLDDNLPSLVERLVQDEIERVSRGRR